MRRFAMTLGLVLGSWTGTALAQTCLEELHAIRDADVLPGGPVGLSEVVATALDETDTGYLTALMENVALNGTPEIALGGFPRCLAVDGLRLSYAVDAGSEPVLEIPLKLLALGKDDLPAEGVAEMDMRSIRFYAPAVYEVGIAGHPGIRLFLPESGGAAQPTAGSGPFVGDHLARFYRIRQTDPAQLAAGVTVLLCVEPCDEALSGLPQTVGTPAPVRPPEARTPDARVVMAEMAETDEAAETEPAPASPPEPDSDAQPDTESDPAPVEADDPAPEPAPDTDQPGPEPEESPVPSDGPEGAELELSPEARANDKFWTRRFADLAEPVFLLDGETVPAPGYRLSCALDADFDVISIEDLLLRLYGPDCLDARDAGFEAVEAVLQSGSTVTDRLQIEVTLRPFRKPVLGGLDVTHDAAPDLYRFCTLSARFAEIVEGMALEQVRFDGAPLHFFNGANASMGYTLPRGIIPLPEGVRWRDLAVEITAPAEAENQTCRLEAPLRLALRDAETDPRIAVDEEGVVTLSNLGIRPNARLVHVFFNTYTGSELVGTAEQGDGLFAFATRRDMLHYATSYADYLIRQAGGGPRPVTHVFYAPDPDGVHREVARLSALQREGDPGWLQALSDALDAQQVNADYADARVTAKLDELRAAGEIGAGTGAEVHVFGRTGFNDPNDYCDAQAFRPFDATGLRIVEFAALSDFPGLDETLGLEHAVPAPIRTIHCRDGLAHHIIMFPDSSTLRPTGAELSQSFDGLARGKSDGE